MTRPARPMLVGNWKMWASRDRLAELAPIAATAEDHPGLEIVICPPAPLIEAATRYSPPLAIGGQNSHRSLEGSFTGSISAALLRDLGATFVILGHSERREAGGERDADVRAKAETALAVGLTPIICVGERAADRAAGRAEAVIAAQLAQSVPRPVAPGSLIIAYEPIWAIGGSATPTTAEIAAMHDAIRTNLAHELGQPHRQATRILYGGSVTAANAASLIGIAGVDGLLVGGASLRARDFVPIVTSVAAQSSREPAAMSAGDKPC